MINLLEYTRRPDIFFYRNGTIRIKAHVARILSLCPGDIINIAVNQGEYLLHASRVKNCIGRREAQCYPTKKGSDNYCANSVRLCRLLLSAIGSPADKVAFNIGEPIEISGKIYIPIITKNPI